jgi:uncharacterized protein (DUF2141 family)
MLGIENSSLAGSKSSLEVNFSKLKSSKGQVCMSLFSGASGFPRAEQGASIVSRRCAPIIQGTAQVIFNVPYGNYAIAAVHDTNGDMKLNSNFLGIPKEGIGFSNNPRVRTKPPSFVESQFLVTNAKTRLQIQMQYF